MFFFSFVQFGLTYFNYGMCSVNKLLLREGALLKFIEQIMCPLCLLFCHLFLILCLFSEIHYVSVIRAIDNSTPPCLDSSLNAASPEHSFQVEDDSIKQAIAGPMSPAKVLFFLLLNMCLCPAPASLNKIPEDAPGVLVS